MSETLSQSDLIDIQEEVADTYGVDLDDVTTEVVYKASGSLVLDNTDGISDADLQEVLENELASLLGIHEGSVEVSIIDGVAHYTITSDSVESSEGIQEVLSESDSLTALDTAISDSFPEVDVSSLVVDDEIIADVVVTVDTENASNNLNIAAYTLEESFVEQGFNANAESNPLFFISKLNGIHKIISRYNQRSQITIFVCCDFFVENVKKTEESLEKLKVHHVRFLFEQFNFLPI